MLYLYHMLLRRLIGYTVVYVFCTLAVWAQPVPPCSLDYGSTTDEQNIVMQMRYGSITGAVNAIQQAQNTRGVLLGCPQTAITYTTGDTTRPTLAWVTFIWNNLHAPAISATPIYCPKAARYENNAALGGYYARLAGYYNDTIQLAEITDMMYYQQYASWNVSSPQPRNEGVFGYISVPSTDTCYAPGIIGAYTDTVCNHYPAYCITYTNGTFAGKTFAISAQDDATQWFDGGMAYDHGWAGILMIESAIQQGNILQKQKYRESAMTAGLYALHEYPVKNHNYTAKLIWLLAELYAWTGDSVYKNELNHKLDKNLIPGILWDDDNNNMVDGTSPPIAFASLTTAAQTPGRMWDAHNATLWYQAMNTWAMLEAYVAFRDRGDLTRAAELKPYAIKMLDNISGEIITQGVPATDAVGVRDITYALLLGIWKLSQYENEAHINWEQAAWAMWNTGYFNNYNTHSVCVGLYLLVLSETPYTPLAARENFVLGTEEPTPAATISLYPNPATNLLNVQLASANTENVEGKIMTTTGQVLICAKGSGHTLCFDVSALLPGTYLIQIETGNIKCVKKWIKIN